jgi:hypothetical protein
MAPPLPNSAHGDQLISAKRRGIPGETAPEPDTVSHIKSVRRRWTASEKVRIVAEKGKVAFRHACLMGLEGIVSKRLGSKYRSGRRRTGPSSRTRRRPL